MVVKSWLFYNITWQKFTTHQLAHLNIVEHIWAELNNSIRKYVIDEKSLKIQLQNAWNYKTELQKFQILKH